MITPPEYGIYSLDGCQPGDRPTDPRLVHGARDAEVRKVIPLYQVEQNEAVDFVLLDGRGILGQLERVGEPGRHRRGVQLLHLERLCIVRFVSFESFESSAAERATAAVLLKCCTRV
jgi:hypothetical protein